MRKQVILGLLCLFCHATLVAQETDSTKPLLETYMESHPQTVRTKFIHDGCSLSLSADSSNLFVQLYIINPMLQMRLLMQECYFFIDPTGKKKEKYAIVLPSAKYVQGYAGNAMLRPTSSDKHPDLSGLLTILNLYGAEWNINGQITQLHSDRFRLVFDTVREALIYTALVPRDALSKEKNSIDAWSFGFYSPIDGGTPPPNGPMSDRNGRHSNVLDSRPQEDDAKLRSFLSKAIQQWTTIPIKEIEDINNSGLSHRILRGKGYSIKHDFEIAIFIANDTLSITTSSADSAIHLGFIMQGLCLDMLNPFGDSIGIRFPSAFDVKDKIQHHPDEIRPSWQDGEPSRPDLRYLLSELNDAGLAVSGSVAVKSICYGITATPDSGLIVFHAQILAKGFVAEGPVKIVVSSIPSEEMRSQPEFDVDGDKKTRPTGNGQHEYGERNRSIRETIVLHITNVQL